MKRGSSKGWITTYTGRRVWPLDPHPDDVCLLDIAHALAHLCRFTGHVREFYSVAEHCVRASFVTPQTDSLWALLHDAGEAYLLDLARPVKHLPELAAYREAEARWEEAIATRFGLEMPIPLSVKVVDGLLLRTEQRDLTLASEWRNYEVLPTRIEPWATPKLARWSYLVRFRELLPDHPDLVDAAPYIAKDGR